MRYFTYPVKLTRDRKDGGYVVTCRDLPEAITQGNTIEEALSESEGALQAAIEGRIEDGLEVPAPSRARRGERMVSTPITTALKAAVFLEMQKQGVSKSELARRMQVHEKEARRMLDPHHPTRVPTLERALAALLAAPAARYLGVESIDKAGLPIRQAGFVQRGRNGLRAKLVGSTHTNDFACGEIDERASAFSAARYRMLGPKSVLMVLHGPVQGTTARWRSVVHHGREQHVWPEGRSPARLPHLWFELWVGL
ncbi:MAG: type II toxin-antitoxin system HicB family antitoxin [Betaproteobacteria bacterium]